MVIPGDQLGDYVAAMAEVEQAREPLRRALEALNAEFGAYLAAKYPLGGGTVAMAVHRARALKGAMR